MTEQQRRTEALIKELRRRNGQLFAALQESAPHRLVDGEVVPEASDE